VPSQRVGWQPDLTMVFFAVGEDRFTEHRQVTVPCSVTAGAEGNEISAWISAAKLPETREERIGLAVKAVLRMAREKNWLSAVSAMCHSGMFGHEPGIVH
jgi:hypothetical protein